MPVITTSFRVTPTEAKAIREAAEALDLGMAQLVQSAAVSAAHQLGFFDGEPLPIRPKREWKYAPIRDDESASNDKLTITLTQQSSDLAKQAAAYVRTIDGGDVTFSMFCVGATLKYIASKRASLPRDSPIAKKLKNIKLPPQYT